MTMTTVDTQQILQRLSILEARRKKILETRLLYIRFFGSDKLYYINIIIYIVSL